MNRATVALVAVISFAVAGCEGSGMSMGTSGTETAQLAAYAASEPYPTNIRASDDLRSAAMINNDGDIRVVNFSDQPIRNAKVWVNGAFVRHVDSIPPHGSVTLAKSKFFDSAGNSMGKVKTSISRVQLQTDDHLYNLMGPIHE